MPYTSVRPLPLCTPAVRLAPPYTANVPDPDSNGVPLAFPQVPGPCENPTLVWPPVPPSSNAPDPTSCSVFIDRLPAAVASTVLPLITTESAVSTPPVRVKVASRVAPGTAPNCKVAPVST